MLKLTLTSNVEILSGLKNCYLLYEGLVPVLESDLTDKILL